MLWVIALSLWEWSYIYIRLDRFDSYHEHQQGLPGCTYEQLELKGESPGKEIEHE